MPRDVALTLSDEEVRRLDLAVANGEFESAEAAIREGLSLALERPGEREIAESYRRAYGDAPEDGEAGEIGLRLMSDRLREQDPPS